MVLEKVFNSSHIYMYINKCFRRHMCNKATWIPKGFLLTRINKINTVIQLNTHVPFYNLKFDTALWASYWNNLQI